MVVVYMSCAQAKYIYIYKPLSIPRSENKLKKIEKNKNIDSIIHWSGESRNGVRNGEELGEESAAHGAFD